MGIKWLTSYVADIQQSISSEATLSIPHDTQDANSKDKKPVATFVVDGWAFIYRIWLTRFGDAVRGLDLQAYKVFVANIVHTWAAAGIQVIFIFDGPMLPVKLPCLVERRAKVSACNQAYMTSSAQSKASRRFQIDCGVIPPTLLFATIDALKQAGASTSYELGDGSLDASHVKHTHDIELVFAPTEADSLVAEIAASKPRGYAISQDSDYFVLCARGHGCAYVPLESIEYLVDVAAGQPQAGSGKLPPSADDTRTTSQDRDAELAAALSRGEIKDTPVLDDGFEQVGARKRGMRKQQAGPSFTPSWQPKMGTTQLAQFPPLASEESIMGKAIGVRFRAYRSIDLAANLQLSPTLLPLLAAIVGNDYSSSLQKQTLLKHVLGAQRITLAARLLRDEWVRIRSGAASRSSSRDGSRRKAQVRRGNGRMSTTQSSPYLSGEDDDSRSEVGSSATATPTVRSITTSTLYDPVRTLVEAVVDRALAETINNSNSLTHITSGERSNIIESVIDSAAAYSLLTQSNAPHLASPSALFFGEGMSLLLAHRTNSSLTHDGQPEALAKYRMAYAHGHFNPTLIEAMTQRVFITSFSPEAPDVASVHRTIARSLRAWIYAVLFDTWGMGWARDTWSAPTLDSESDGERSDDGHAKQSLGPDRTYREGEHPDDVISVHTESSESEDEASDMQDLPTRPASVTDFREDHDSVIKPAPGIKEYVRAGSQFNGQLVRVRSLATLLRYGTHLDADYEVDEASISNSSPVPTDSSNALPTSLAELLDAKSRASSEYPSSLLLLPKATRMDLYWHAHDAHTSAIKALPATLWLVASALRIILVHAAEQLKTSGRNRDNWSRSELRVAFQSALCAQEKHAARVSRTASLKPSASSMPTGPSVALPSARAIHLGSTLQLVAQTSALLAQALLLTACEDLTDGVNSSSEALFHPESVLDGPCFYEGMAHIHDGGEGEGQDVPANGRGAAAASSSTVEAAKTSELVTRCVDAVTEGLTESLGIDALDLKRERKAKRRAAREQKVADQQEASAASLAAEEEVPRNAKLTSRGRNGARGAGVQGKNAFALLDEASM